MKLKTALITLLALVPAGTTAETHPPPSGSCSIGIVGWSHCRLNMPCAECVGPDGEYNFSMSTSVTPDVYSDCYLFLEGGFVPYYRVDLFPSGAAQTGCDDWYSFLAVMGSPVRTFRCKTPDGTTPNPFTVLVRREVLDCP